jgi:hypothetical protein
VGLPKAHQIRHLAVPGFLAEKLVEHLAENVAPDSRARACSPAGAVSVCGTTRGSGGSSIPRSTPPGWTD